MKKKFLAILLAIVMAVSLLPGTASAANSLPDWYFLFAIIKNVDADCDSGSGVLTHTKYTMTQYEADVARGQIEVFEKYMNQTGVMRAHVDVVELDGPITKMATGSYQGSSLGSYVSAEQAAPLLKAKGIDLDKYDHVTCVASLNVDTTGYLGITGSAFDNGTGQSFINLRNQSYVQRNLSSNDNLKIAYVHEILHFMERMCSKWGKPFDVHKICEKFYGGKFYVEETYTKIILNQIRGNAETGTGVFPAAWQCPPRVFRTISDLTIPDGATSIGYDAFDSCTNLKSVVIPGGVTSLEDYAFYKCSNLKSVTIPNSVTSIGYAAFWDTDLKDVYYTGTQAQWNAIKIGEFNAALTKANIHCNSVPAGSGTPGPSTSFTDVPDWCAVEAGWAADNGVAKGVGNNRFSPGATCTNIQILTFLWRANGKQTAASHFTLSDPDYQSAANWAYEEGLIGSSFNPNAPCTRATAVKYIWQVRGSDSTDAAGSSFTDVRPSADYARAVSWAVANGIANGYGDTFRPSETCTRGQIVAFLYRAYVKPLSV